MPSRFILPFADVGSGILPSSGSKLYFYAAGTTTPKDTHTTKAASTANSNPLVSDSKGVFPDIFISGSYKVILKDKNNVQKWEADPVDELSLGDADTNLINDLSQSYIFDTVTAYQESAIVFPVGKIIHLKDRGADFEVIAGVSTGNDMDIIANTNVNQSIDLTRGKQFNRIDIIALGANPVAAFDNAAIVERSAELVKGGIVYSSLSGRFEMSRTAFIPIGVTLDGYTGNRSFSGNFDDTVQFASQAAGTYVENFLFFMNLPLTGDTETWVQQFPNNASGGVRNLSIDGSDTNGINGFKFAGSHVFEDLDSNKIGSMIRKPTGMYTDKVAAKRFHSRNRANLTDYLVDLPGLGDGYEIRTIASGFLVSSTPDDTGNGLLLGPTRGTDVYGMINGHHLLDRCLAVDFHGAHIENGSITLQDGNANIRDNIIFNEEEHESQIILSSVGDTFNNRYEVTIENNIFDQSMNRRGGFQSTTTHPDIIIDNAFSIKLKNNKRKITDSTEVAKQAYMGVVLGTSPTLLLAEYNDYSHLFSNYECQIVRGNVIQTGVIPGQRFNFNGVTASSQAITDAAFSGITDTYFYTAQLVLDKPRNIGINSIGAEASVSLTSGGNLGLITMAWGSVENRGIVTLRVYRGTVSGSYDKSVNIPVVSLQQLFDSGDSLNGFLWIDRTAGAVGGLNSGLGGAVVLDDGFATAHTVGGLPTLGTWKQGDRVIKTSIAPVGAGSTITTEFYRVTDGSGHVNGTDWLKLGKIEVA